MAKATYGQVTTKQGGGEGDPHILKLQENNRFRLVEPQVEKWRQHGIRSPSDDDQFRSAVCPRGADGYGDSMCPCCVKPVTVGDDGKQVQTFPISRRYAVNVWDYESGSVKVLMGGPQIFEEFDTLAAAGMDPMAADWVLIKLGSGRDTKYKMVRSNETPFTETVTPDMLHDTDKYGVPDTAEQMFQKMEEMGIDYDAIQAPTFTLAEAQAYQLPFGKFKGMTMEQVEASDVSYLEWLHNSRLEQGQLGDPLFIAVHTVLEAGGHVKPLDNMKVPPRAAFPTTSAPEEGAPPVSTPTNDMIKLVGPGGGPEVEVPEAAVGALLQQGYTRHEPPKPEPAAAPGLVELIGPDFNTITVPEEAVAGLFKRVGAPAPEAPSVSFPATMVNAAGVEVPAADEGAKAALEAAGFTLKQEEPVASEPPAEPADDDTVSVDISGTMASMTYAQAKPLIASGAAKLVTAAEPTPEPPKEPVDTDDVKIDISGTETVMKYKDAKGLIAAGAATLVEVVETPPVRIPADDEEVMVKLSAVPTPVPMTWATYKQLPAGQGTLEDRALAAAWALGSAADASTAQMRDESRAGQVQQDPPAAGSSSGDSGNLDPSLTYQDGDVWKHPALLQSKPEGYKTKGAVTQALNRMKSSSGDAAGTGTATGGSTPTGTPTSPGGEATERDALINEAKALLQNQPEIQSDFNKLLGLFEEVAGGKRNISDFTDDEIKALVAKLKSM